MIKDLLLMSLRQKAGKVNWEELGTNASFLPLIYLMVMAPGFLALLGFCCFLTAGVGELTIDSNISVGFFVKIGSSLMILSFLLVFTYRMIIKRQFKLVKKLTVEQPAQIPQLPMEQLISPFLKQLHSEQQSFLKKPQV